MEITIKSQPILDDIAFRLGKSADTFAMAELMSVDELYVNALGLDDKHKDVDLSELKFFTGLKSLTLGNMTLGEREYEILNGLKVKSLTFDHCTVDLSKVLSHRITSLCVLGGNVTMLSSVYDMVNLEDLKLVSLKDINARKLSNLTSLKTLSLNDSIVSDISGLNIRSLYELQLIHTILDEFKMENLNGIFSRLHTLYISEIQYRIDSDYFKKLERSGLEILDEYGFKFYGI